jgi:formamidopyrimidine-DNA glycosylase
VPELPEVETVVRDLRPRVVGRCIERVRVGKHPLRRPWQARWTKALAQRRVEAARRRGKWIVLDLDGGGHLVVHLGMTGQFTVVSSAEPMADHVHAIFSLDDGRELRFRDVRRFGSLTLFADADQLHEFFETAGLGPEPFDLPADYWRERLAAMDRCLKAVLLDQRVVAGVGNIYADESLFQAQLHPAQTARSLSAGDADRLRQAIAAVLNQAIARRGSSIRDYVGGSGLRGEFQNEFRVYGRTGQPCPRCQTAIERLRLAGRSTHFCPKCQTFTTESQRTQRGKKEKIRI